METPPQSKDQSVRADPLPLFGTMFHRRWRGEREISPEYRGPGGLTAACAEARREKISLFAWGGKLYEMLDDELWYAVDEVCWPKPRDKAPAPEATRTKSMFAEYEELYRCHGGEGN